MSSEIAVRIKNLSKCYQLYDKPSDRLKQSIVPNLQRLFGKNTKSYYRQFWALNDISFEIKRGETLGIIGRNGSGKSTLLQLICGTLNPTRGSVEVNGRVAALLELGSGFNPEFSGRENIYHNASILGLSTEQIKKRFEKIVEFADIGNFLDQPVKTYSSGMLVRLAFAVIAHVDADILVIDEALAVGDVFFVQKCMRFLRDFTQDGTLIFVSHDTASVVGLCSNAILLNQGQLLKIGSPKDVSDFYLSQLHKGLVDATVISDAATAVSASETPGAEDPGIEDRYTESEFGTGRVQVQSVKLLNADGLEVVTPLVGGERVTLMVTLMPKAEIALPIVGFLVRDRLGQIVFGSNTFSNTSAQEKLSQPFQKNKLTRVCLDFIAPVLQVGDYSLGVAVAEGTQAEHIQHHWIHDALVLKFRPEVWCAGLLGVQLDKITILTE